jgi:hypothetical protein
VERGHHDHLQPGCRGGGGEFVLSRDFPVLVGIPREKS